MGHPWVLLGAGADTGYGCLITQALCQPNIPNFNAFSSLQRWTESKLVMLNVPVRYYFLLIRWSAKSQNTEQKRLSHPQETSPHRCLQQGQIKTFCPARGFAPPRSLRSEVSWEFTMHVDCGCLQAPRWVWKRSQTLSPCLGLNTMLAECWLVLWSQHTLQTWSRMIPVKLLAHTQYGHDQREPLSQGNLTSDSRVGGSRIPWDMRSSGINVPKPVWAQPPLA